MAVDRQTDMEGGGALENAAKGKGSGEGKVNGKGTAKVTDTLTLKKFAEIFGIRFRDRSKLITSRPGEPVTRVKPHYEKPKPIGMKGTSIEDIHGELIRLKPGKDAIAKWAANAPAKTWAASAPAKNGHRATRASTFMRNVCTTDSITEQKDAKLGRNCLFRDVDPRMLDFRPTVHIDAQGLDLTAEEYEEATEPVKGEWYARQRKIAELIKAERAEKLGLQPKLEKDQGESASEARVQTDTEEKNKEETAKPATEALVPAETEVWEPVVLTPCCTYTEIDSHGRVVLVSDTTPIGPFLASRQPMNDTPKAKELKVSGMNVGYKPCIVSSQRAGLSPFKPREDAIELDAPVTSRLAGGRSEVNDSAANGSEVNDPESDHRGFVYKFCPGQIREWPLLRDECLDVPETRRGSF